MGQVHGRRFRGGGGAGEDRAFRFTRAGESGIGSRMPIVAFENRRTATLELVIEPGGETHEVPHLATAGILYSLDEGAEDRSMSVVEDDRIEFWCNAVDVKVDIVLPSPFESLLWDICANLGFCGGLVKGEPTHVSDLLPAAGSISAEEFANFAMRAEGDWPIADDARLGRWRERLQAKFIEHLGAPVVPVATLKEIQRRPFDAPEPG
jgi:hypothetical protein